MLVNGTDGGRVPYFKMPSVGVNEGCPGTKVGVAVLLDPAGAPVEVGNVAVRLGGGKGDAVVVDSTTGEATTGVAVEVAGASVTVGRGDAVSVGAEVEVF